MCYEEGQTSLSKPMLPSDASKQHAQVILDHVESRAFPESESVASADLSPESWPEVALRIKEAREALKVGDIHDCTDASGDC